MKLCNPRINSVFIEKIDGRFCYDDDRPRQVKRKRVKCPLCGRRLFTSVRWLELIGFEVLHTIPPHKPKGWWKK